VAASAPVATSTSAKPPTDAKAQGLLPSAGAVTEGAAAVVAHCITADAREGTASSIGVLDSSSGDVGKMLESATSILNSGVILFQTARWCAAPSRDCSMF
jgi:hypothetical protein